MSGKIIYLYDSSNRLKSVNYSDGGEIIYDYDRAGNIISVVTRAGKQPSFESPPSTADPSAHPEVKTLQKKEEFRQEISPEDPDSTLPVSLWKLVIVSGEWTGKIFPLFPGIRLGRGKDCEIRVSDPMASKLHAIFKPSGDGYLVEDLGSNNGTLVNGILIDRPVAIYEGTTITAGETTFVVKGKSDTLLISEDKTIPLKKTVPPPSIVKDVSSPLSGVICPQCNMTLSPGSKFCRKCSDEVTEIELSPVPAVFESSSSVLCPECKIVLSPGARFCRKCGKTV